ncbi:TetR/AcrR family transcriptional regulator [Microbacterium sp. X-17]|uniref:TetR/AcrR family transcriptional regulator n=1 Tax=Microbacterium sp. X-17 TaxID=3144404 RepID=UPI0031F5B693
MDPRVARTRRSLQEALLELARRRPLDEITVGDIVERAGVNRSSFYQHYTDKDTLLADALEVAIGEVSAPIVADPDYRMPPALVAYLEHLAANAALYRRVLGPHGSALVANRLRARVHQIAQEHLAYADAGIEGLPADIAAAGIAGSALGVVTAWIALDPLPTADVAADWVWRTLLGPGRAWRPADEVTS